MLLEWRKIPDVTEPMSGKIEVSRDRFGDVYSVGLYIEQVFMDMIIRSLPAFTNVDLAESACDSVDRTREGAAKVVRDVNAFGY